jgi:long-chain acyl-CoA synthetase
MSTSTPAPAKGYFPGARRGTATILAHDGSVLSFEELDQRATRLANALRERGIAVGDPVAILLDNHDRFLEVLWGCHYAGAQYVAVSSHLRAGEIGYIVNDSQARGLITSQRFGGELGEVDGLARFAVRLCVDGRLPDFEDYRGVLAAADPAVPEEPRIAGVDRLYSSGTTGRPKAILRDLAAMPLESASPGATYACKRVFGMSDSSVYLTTAPLYHAGPLRMAMGAQALGATVVQTAGFDAEQFLQIVDRHRVTHTFMVPTMFTRLLALPDDVRRRYDLSSLQNVIHSAAPCPEPVKRAMIEWLGPVVSEFYSGTEGAAMTYATSEEWLARPGTVGRPVNCVLHIVGEHGDELPVGQIGEIFFEGGVTFSYSGDESKTAESRHSRGWSSLGDIGYLDDEGYLFLTDRKSNLIISGGVNIYPQEVEDTLLLHPAVADAAVFGIPNAEFGEEVKAVVQPHSMPTSVQAAQELESELIAHARRHISSMKCPRSIDFRPELPREPSGKLMKRRVRDEYLQAQRNEGP